MRTVFVLFDSLNRLALGAYGGKDISTPNFDRFAQRAVTFDKHYVGSLPCMPARRDMQTGRLNFMHRPWGPLEPFDNCYPRMLCDNGIYSHLITDHYHYFEEGGWGYASAFESWEFIRGQEMDVVKAMLNPPVERFRELYDPRHYPIDKLDPKNTTTRATLPFEEWKRSRHMISREFIREEKEFPTAKCFAAAFDFFELNKEADNWFLQLECFDPHEPFHVPDRFREAYCKGYDGKILNWPHYEKVTESAEEIAQIRGHYAALVAMCDEYFGKLLDLFDEHDMWENTCLLLTTDHGYLLSEHEWWAKNRMPYYEEISHIPLMIAHPNMGSRAGTRFSGLSQTTDLMPTILDMEGIDLPPEVTSRSLMPAILDGDEVRDVAIFGMFSGPLGVTDGRYAYYLYPEERNCENLNMYTLMPAHLRKLFDVEELKNMQLAGPFNFTKGISVMKVPMDPRNSQVGAKYLNDPQSKTALYDLSNDPAQERPIESPEIVARLLSAAILELEAHHAPPEYYSHFGLDHSGK